MKKVVAKKTYDTEEMELVKKVTVGNYGDPAGYEEILFAAKDGTMFLYCNGGENSKYPAESLTKLTKAKLDAWKSAN